VAVGWTGNGQPLIDRFNGTRFTLMRAPTVDATLTGVSCPSPVSCVAVGATTATPFRVLIERWDGHTWSLEPSPTPPTVRHAGDEDTLNAVSCPRATWCMAVGTVLAGDEGPLLSERFDGRRWSVVRMPGQGILSSVTCPAANACLAGGISRQPAQPILAERWDGRRWSSQATPTDTASGTSQNLTAIACTAMWRCLGVPALMSLTGSTWTAFPDQLPGQLNGVSCPSAALCVGVGTIELANPDDPDTSTTLIARYP
jgi:hypothetical protein